MSSRSSYDYVIVGGGLQGCLLAHALQHHRPTAKTLLLERSGALCGNHTWSFHGTDIPEEAAHWFEPLVNYRWPAYRVQFPGFQRRVEIPYGTIASESLRTATQELASGPGQDGGGLTVLLSASCTIGSENEVVLASGDRVRAELVVDCRGRTQQDPLPASCGFQAFLGLEVQTERDWPFPEPTVMDVLKEQSHGFEFLYELPLGPRRVLLEYTRFSEEPKYDTTRAFNRIERRLREVETKGSRVLRIEKGCLPMPYVDLPRTKEAALCGGFRGGWYHAATGYSMPLAVRFAEVVARSDAADAAQAVAALTAQDRARRTYTRGLNRMLFRLIDSKERWKVFSRFYRVLPEQRIARFYAHRFTASDAARIVLGWPPAGMLPLQFAKSLFSPVQLGAT